MEKKIKGSWLIHHTEKLQGVTNQLGYDKTFLAGKAGILLSAISSDDDIRVPNQKLEVLAQAANINRLELPTILKVLLDHKLITTSATGLAVLGVTTSSALQHTADIFDSLEPTVQENAALALAEQASLQPISASHASEELGDTFHLTHADIAQLLIDAEQIGFV